jgi:hypothetical protein
VSVQCHYSVSAVSVQCHYSVSAVSVQCHYSVKCGSDVTLWVGKECTKECKWYRLVAISAVNPVLFSGVSKIPSCFWKYLGIQGVHVGPSCHTAVVHSVTLLLHCSYTVVTLLLHCCYTVVTRTRTGWQRACSYQFRVRCYTVVTLLLHGCHTVATRLLHCCHTVVTLLSHCCHTVVTLLLHWHTPADSTLAVVNFQFVARRPSLRVRVCVHVCVCVCVCVCVRGRVDVITVW